MLQQHKNADDFDLDLDDGEKSTKKKGGSKKESSSGKSTPTPTISRSASSSSLATNNVQDDPLNPFSDKREQQLVNFEWVCCQSLR